MVKLSVWETCKEQKFVQCDRESSKVLRARLFTERDSGHMFLRGGNEARPHGEGSLLPHGENSHVFFAL